MANGFPGHCVECGLYKKARTWCLQEETDSRPLPGLWDHRPILVVSQSPSYSDDALSSNMGGEVGDFVRAFTNRLDVPIIFDYVVRCYGGKDDTSERDKQPDEEEISLCSENYLAKTIAKHNPAVIICLGTIPMKSVLGKHAPKTIHAAAKAPIRFSGLPDTWVLTTYQPISHVNGTKDLREDYLRIFSLAEDIVLNGYKESDMRWELILDPMRAEQELSKISSKVVFYDTEIRIHDASEERKTIWHPGYEMICASFTFPSKDFIPLHWSSSWSKSKDPTGDGVFGRPSIDGAVVGPHNIPEKDQGLRTIVLAGAALTAGNVRRALANRIVGCHNLPFDFQAAYVSFGFDPYDIVSGLIDTLQDMYLPDQSKFNNGLKAVCERHLRIPAWDEEVWNQIDAEQHKRGQFNRSLRSLNKQREKENLPLLEKQDTNVDFSVVNLEDLAKYCAFDTHNDARLKIEYLDSRNADDLPPKEAMLLIMRALQPLARTERQGIPFLEERLFALQAAHEQKVEELTEILLAQPEVQDALWRLRKKKEGKIPKDASDRDLFNVKSSDFFECLLDSTRCYVSERTESNRIASGAGIIKRLGAVDRKPEADGQPVKRNRAEWIWYYFYYIRQSRDIKSKFIEQYRPYIVDSPDGTRRAHTTFKIARTELPDKRTSGADDVGGGAKTGRLASTKIQAHNIKKDPSLRRAIGFRDNELRIVMESDYDRIEPVCLTVLSGCVEWAKALHEKIDLYKMIATKIPTLGYDNPDQVSKKDRDLIKKHTLAVMYDESPKSFARDIGIPEKEAREFYDYFYSAFPEIRAWKHETKRNVVFGKKIKTLFGRQKSFSLSRPDDNWTYLIDLESLEIDSLNRTAHENLSVLREAINFPVQSLASDITMWKLRDIYHWLDYTGNIKYAHPFNTVHDAVWFEIEKNKITEIVPSLIRIMEDMSSLPITFTMPLGVTLKIGSNLGRMMEIDKATIPKFIEEPMTYILAAQSGEKDGKNIK